MSTEDSLPIDTVSGDVDGEAVGTDSPKNDLYDPRESCRVDGLDEGEVTSRSSLDHLHGDRLDDAVVPHPRDLESGIDTLLLRHRNEIMFELRRLQHGDRPVTGDETRRQAINNLVRRFTRSTNSTSVEQVDTTSQSRALRPEHILVEVEALVERRPVSSILQSAAVRSSIERSLREAFSSLSHTGDSPLPVPPGARFPRRQPIRADGQSTPRDTSSRPSSSHTDQVDRESTTPSSSSASAIRDLTLSNSEPLRDLPSQPSGPDRAAAWLHQNHDNAIPHDESQRLAAIAQFIEQTNREEFIAEISELIQSQLVTSALGGPIRDVLERQMRGRLDQSGIDGRRVVEQLRQLPRSDVHRRNDFWDLGIMATGNQQNDVDDISVISATAAVALPQTYTQSNAALCTEMRSLRQQMMELKSMMQLSFDLQLDIQRAIRQEVSAAVSAAIGSGTVETPGERSRRVEPAGDQGNCLICLDRAVDTALYQCGHMCLCYTCGMRLRQQGAHCPVCRAPVRDIIRTYRSA